MAQDRTASRGRYRAELKALVVEQCMASGASVAKVAMVRVGEDISERLDIVPAEFFVQRQIRDWSTGGAPAPVMGLPVLPDDVAGASLAPDVRQRHPHTGPASPHRGQPRR